MIATTVALQGGMAFLGEDSIQQHHVGLQLGSLSWGLHHPVMTWSIKMLRGWETALLPVDELWAEGPSPG